MKDPLLPLVCQRSLWNPQAKELACDKAIDLLFDSAVVLVADLENEKNDLIKEFARELLKEIMHFKLYQRKIGDSFWNLYIQAYVIMFCKIFLFFGKELSILKFRAGAGFK